ncbi:hypothetical protein [Candidatus Nitrosacidococcus sp. I8]|uniref:hypothetical protein n=1 Tax=Candidatus Nitrosacidococcus sp. I8 TaxID=2942908 RepID=UPI002226C835|nr:hypothetical protein [Candidatus Nitrosacidococcus sp. I8]
MKLIKLLRPIQESRIDSKNAFARFWYMRNIWLFKQKILQDYLRVMLISYDDLVLNSSAYFKKISSYLDLLYSSWQGSIVNADSVHLKMLYHYG